MLVSVSLAVTLWVSVFILWIGEEEEFVDVELEVVGTPAEEDFGGDWDEGWGRCRGEWNFGGELDNNDWSTERDLLEELYFTKEISFSFWAEIKNGYM